MKYKSMQELNKVHQYIMQMRPILRKEALFSDGTKDYRIPPEPKEYEEVAIRFRTAQYNVDMVWLWANGNCYQMHVAENDGTFDYYEVRVPLGAEAVSYYFEILSGQVQCYYDRYGVSREIRENYFFRITPGFSTPDWAKGAVMYQIMVDRFCNGDESADVLDGEYFYIHTHSKRVPKEQWDKCPENFSVGEFYGGDLEGVRSKLDYLSALGVEVLYFNPLFVSPSNHKYDIQDYDHIDPHFARIIEDEGELLAEGEQDNRKATRYCSRVTSQKNLEASNAFFADFVKEAHSRGMRVILDGVFNHCGSFNCWMDRERIYEGKEGFLPGAYVSRESPYRSYFKFKENDETWEHNKEYEGWWGHDTLPKLNYEESETLRADILRIARKWVSEPYCCDGWRLDVAEDLGHTKEYNHKFWRDFRKAVKDANPDAIILAEHYGDPREWLAGDQWDTIMNYAAFMEPLTYFLTGMEKHSDEFYPERIGRINEFEGAMRHYMASFMTPSLQCSMNQLSNHDHSRFLTRTNHKAGRVEFLGPAAASEGVDYRVMREAAFIQMTWPGAPTLYYGDEAGLCGFTDPDNRRTYPWGNENQGLIDLHRELILIHKQNEAFRTGSFLFLDGEDHFLCYTRFTRAQQFIVIVNNDDIERGKELAVTAAGIPLEAKLRRVIMTTENGYSRMPQDYEVSRGKAFVSVKGKSAMILRRV
ncbi:MAG: glycoside hydrolase family 13 protein [Eubacterium sp.]|jgi:alpha-glucosidase|nr:glycoside hydrolase family 13 protein [Eubacterium sp.]NBI87272.1 glycoside hydrolase family 13 protein [Lachnospiraceae bacterium]